MNIQIIIDIYHDRHKLAYIKNTVREKFGARAVTQSVRHLPCEQ